MQLILRLVSRLVGVVLLCFALTAGWVMIDAHNTIGQETAASGERVVHELENLFWRELLWRSTLRGDRLLLPAPNWESVATLKLISPGVCITLVQGADEPRTLCSQLEGVGAAAPDWFSKAFATMFGPHMQVSRPLTLRQPNTGVVVASAEPGAAVRQAWRQITVVMSVGELAPA